MKQYFVKYGNFANAYSLAWAETESQIRTAEAQGYEQISRKQAEKLCAAENYRRNHDEAFSGYADNIILPIDFPRMDEYWRNDRTLHQNGYIIERK